MDIGVTVSDGRTTIVAGQTAVFEVVVSNLSASTADAVAINQTLSAAFENISWTCSGSGGASCPASGTGALGLTQAITASGQLTFQVSATVNSATPPSTVSTTVTVAVQAPQTDPNAANDSAADSTDVVTDPLLADGFESP